MPTAGYVLKLSSLVIFGIISFIIAALIFIMLLPYILLAVVGIGLLVLIFFLIWFLIYAGMMLGAALYYIFKPMKVEKKGDYRVSRTKEAGMRQKGTGKKGKK